CVRAALSTPLFEFGGPRRLFRSERFWAGHLPVEHLASLRLGGESAQAGGSAVRGVGSAEDVPLPRSGPEQRDTAVVRARPGRIPRLSLQPVGEVIDTGSA